MILGPFGHGVMDCCELPCWCWELDLGPLQEQMLKTINPFCQPHSAFISILVKRQNKFRDLIGLFAILESTVLHFTERQVFS